MSGKLLLHEGLHELCTNQKLQCLDLFLIGDVFPSDALERLVAPETFVFATDVPKLHGCRLAVGLVEVLVNVQNSATFLV